MVPGVELTLVKPRDGPVGQLLAGNKLGGFVYVVGYATGWITDNDSHGWLGPFTEGVFEKYITTLLPSTGLSKRSNVWVNLGFFSKSHTNKR